jgi:hypothetical protein
LFFLQTQEVLPLLMVPEKSKNEAATMSIREIPENINLVEFLHEMMD